MKIKVKVPAQIKEIDVAHVLISVPVRYDEEDIPNDFPLRVGDLWRAKVSIETGQIENWPKEATGEFYMYMKVCDEGIYTLLDWRGDVIAKLEDDYVPNKVVPGEYGDYIELEIANGVITNWPKNPDVSKFFAEEED